jgi:hypothetical protein
MPVVDSKCASSWQAIMKLSSFPGEKLNYVNMHQKCRKLLYSLVKVMYEYMTFYCLLLVVRCIEIGICGMDFSIYKLIWFTIRLIRFELFQFPFHTHVTVFLHILSLKGYVCSNKCKTYSGVSILNILKI